MEPWIVPHAVKHFAGLFLEVQFEALRARLALGMSQNKGLCQAGIHVAITTVHITVEYQLRLVVANGEILTCTPLNPAGLTPR